ncbi:aminotransferase class V-fold PLP-dependent enzyme [Kineosporia rhizophila]|uniref:cysteine desulfurase family protein n=1 Tax=Kineosporia TaxID=49184 RepID=UPI001E552AB9|nr:MULTISPECIES: aminotransferase class V-fold PLP-dependent enzyme [Kineosporia]MCE0538287.1 aminotransferase class V-fold PLP-dependent enzyme [Kineosporia rhizophila]GLY18656.1 aminotransferase [Kineosporia sp. NBRC 101677]
MTYGPPARPGVPHPEGVRAQRTYLDASTVAPLHPSGREAWHTAVAEGWADPRRLHREGRSARLLLEGARESIAADLGARTEELVFTGSHTEAVHAAVLGTLHARRRVGRRVVMSAVEHSAVLHAAEFSGEPVLIPVDRLGRVELPAFGEAVSGEGVALACLQAANGEVGTLQPVGAAAEATKKAGVPLLVDAAAAAGHTSIDPNWDLLTADPRSWGAPDGLGVLAIRANTRWLSPYPADEGTEKVPGSVSVPSALAAAVVLRAVTAQRAELSRVRRELTDRIRAAAAAVPDTEVVGDPDERLPHLVTFSSLYVDGEAIVNDLDRRGFAVGSGSACTASTLEPSHVLAAMGVLTHGNVRVGLPVDVRPEAVERFCAALPEAVAQVRSLLGAEDL